MRAIYLNIHSLLFQKSDRTQIPTLGYIRVHAQSLSTLCDPVDYSFCPWDSPGKNNGVGSHSFFQGIFLTQGSNLPLLHCRLILEHWVTREALEMYWVETKRASFLPYFSLDSSNSSPPPSCSKIQFFFGFFPHRESQAKSPWKYNSRSEQKQGKNYCFKIFSFLEL